MLSFAVSRCSLLFLRCFSRAVFRCYFGAAIIEKPGFLRRREGSPLYFSGIISEISERRHRQRPELPSCSCLFTASGLQEFQSLAPDLFSLSRAHARERFPKEVSKPPKVGIQGGRDRAGVLDHRFRGGDEGEEAELIFLTRTTRKRMPDGKPSNFRRSAAPDWCFGKLICIAYHKQLTVLL